jgi:predicted HD superfamily hydrolase involved in NAD metabolism
LSLCSAVRARTGVGRFRHCAGVARMAEKLARANAVSPERARVAGILHDVARGWTNQQLLAYARENGVPISDAARSAPVLLHAPIGADIARREFAIDDPEVLGAISRHTVAGPGMGALDKIIYVADSIEPSRTFDDRVALEALAFRSLDEALFACLKESMKYLMLRNVPIADETVLLYNQLVRHHGSAA